MARQETAARGLLEQVCARTRLKRALGILRACGIEPMTDEWPGLARSSLSPMDANRVIAMAEAAAEHRTDPDLSWD